MQLMLTGCIVAILVNITLIQDLLALGGGAFVGDISHQVSIPLT